MIIPVQNHGKQDALEMMVDFCLQTAAGKKATESILQYAPGGSSCRKPVF
ncbi:MAG TPA: hypothetical protein VFG54_20485 [Prolixibacteraceae bacterium]|nr:hypothetical protein [Prolixibacteraceae bacterium]